MVDISLKPKR